MRVLPLSPQAFPVLLALLATITFLPALGNGFVRWDDHVWLLGNPAYRGLGWAQLRWMATSAVFGQYLPVTWLTFGLDYAVWGMRPLGYHLTNVVLHAANAVLFFLVAMRLLAKAATPPEAARPAAAVAALFFAVHPLRVEAVAWVMGRQHVLSAFFFLATVLLYLDACEAEGRRRRWLLAGSVAAYALALGSKAVVVTAPAILLLLDVYPLRRLPARPGAWLQRPARRIWIEKLPYLLLAVVAAALSSRGAARAGSLRWLDGTEWPGKAVQGRWVPIEKTVLPFGLS